MKTDSTDSATHPDVKQKNSCITNIFGFLTFVLPFMLYFVTAMEEPGGIGDLTKWAFIGKIWGISHPTGCPLYLILSAAFSRLGFGTLIFRVSLLSVISVAISINLIYRISNLIGVRPILSFAIALLAMTSPLIWSQALSPDVYGLQMLLILLSVYTILQWVVTSDDRWMRGTIWIFFLSMANHPTSIFILPGLFIFTLVRKPRVYMDYRTWLHVLGALLIAIAFYSYIPIRSTQDHYWNEGLWDGPLNGDMHRFWLYLSGSDWSNDFGLKLDNTREYFRILIQNLTANMGFIGIIFSVLGFLRLAFKNKPVFILLFLITASALSPILFFRTEEMPAWISPSIPFISILAGFCIHEILEALIFLTGKRDKQKNSPGCGFRALYNVAALVLLLAAGVQMIARYPIIDRSGPSEEYQMAKRIVNAVEYPALLVPNDYKIGMRLAYSYYEDDSMKAEWPYYIGIMEEYRISDAGPSTLLKWPWDEELVNDALEAGIHVYVIHSAIILAHENFWLMPIETGTDDPELMEVILQAAPDAIPPEM